MINNNFIAINKPCHEAWQNMSVSEKGKFCSSCKKEVYDFTDASIDDIKKTFSESIGGMCGRVPVKLLQEQYVEREIQKVHYSYLKKFCLAAILCFGANLFSIDSAKASTFYKVNIAFFNFVTDSKNDSIVVKGVVKDKASHERISFVNVSVSHNDSVICNSVTNLNGEYEIKIPKEYTTVDFEAASIGYDRHILKNIHVSVAKKNVVNIDVKKGERMLMGDMILEQPPLITKDSIQSGK